MEEPKAEQTQHETVPPELAELKAQLELKEQQNKELIERLQRLQADFENYKKRQARESEELLVRLEDRLLTEILPIYDNLERAFRSFNKNNDKDSFIEGIERIFAQFHAFLENKGVRPIPALGELFDPALHEALITVEAEDGGKVLEEFERGYQRAGRVLRPSKVKVSKRRISQEPQSPSGSATP
ncbi:MAG: nucleotide exchange factor GrpE [Candidatus Bipolaricaulota bacterium]|nr:nucleotide exchange factor GrpE [Candidatus Bipolaricaulota bacterium]MDW8031647.1 nucleotide exchange factor GrpE [Candidatus Bipolaricaulota bacterium]